MRFVLYVLAALLALTLCGCSMFGPRDPNAPPQSAEDARAKIAAVVEAAERAGANGFLLVESEPIEFNTGVTIHPGIRVLGVLWFDPDKRPGGTEP